MTRSFQTVLFSFIAFILGILICLEAQAQVAQPGAAAAVFWACKDVETVAEIASSKDATAYSMKVSMYEQMGNCVVFPKMMALILKEFQFPIKGGFGEGEIWSVQMLNDQKAFIAIQANPKYRRGA
jgi:hypothetical protein